MLHGRVILLPPGQYIKATPIAMQRLGALILERLRSGSLASCRELWVDPLAVCAKLANTRLTRYPLAGDLADSAAA